MDSSKLLISETATAALQDISIDLDPGFIAIDRSWIVKSIICNRIEIGKKYSEFGSERILALEDLDRVDIDRCFCWEKSRSVFPTSRVIRHFC